MKGWFAVARGITAHHLFRGNPERLAVWLWLLDNAAWKDTTHDVSGRTIQVPRGSVCASTRHIAEAVGVGHQVVRTALKRFQTEHMINTAATHGKTLITLRNYCKYQDHGSGTNTAPNTALTQQQHSANTQKEQGNKETREAKASQAKRGTRLSDDWFLPKSYGEWAVSEGYDVDAIREQAACFKDYWIGVPGQRGVKLDWEATWRNWMRRSAKASPKRSKGDERLAAAMRAAERFDREKELRLARGTDYDASQPLLHPGHSRYAIGSGDG
jgi:hypothetical protein